MGCLLPQPQAMFDDAAFFDQLFVGYIAVSLRRFAGRWRKALSARTGRQIELLEALPANTPPPEEQCLLASPVDETIADPDLHRAFQKLTNHQREVIVRLVVNGERQLSLANRLGVTQQAIFRTKTQALCRLRTAVARRQDGVSSR